MNQRTRYFLIVSALLVAVGLGTGLVAYYNGGRGSSSSALSDLAYVPATATAVAYADVRTIMNSELRQRLRQLMPSGEQRDKMEAELGLNIERDIDTVIAGYTAGQSIDGGVVLVRGRFDDDMIETKAVQHGATVETYRGKRLVLSPKHVNSGDIMPRDGSAPASPGVTIVPGIAMLEPGLLAFGDAATLRKAIDAAATKVDVTSNADLMRHVNDVQGTGNAWFVTRFDAITGHSGIPDEVRGQLPQLQWIAASANVTGGVTGTLKAEARDEKAAADLHAVVTGGLAAVRMMSGQDKRLEALVNSVQVMGAGKTVSLTFAMQPELFDMLAGVAGMGRSGGAPQR